MFEVIAFLHVIENLEATRAHEYAKMGHRLEASADTGAMGMPQEWLDPIRLSLHHYNEEHSAFERAIGDTAMKRAVAVKMEVARKLKQYKSDVDHLNHGVAKERSQTVSAIAYHEKVAAKRVTTGKDQGAFVDPWLTERVLYKRLRRMVEAENNYQRKVLDLVADMRDFESRVIVEGVRRVFAEYALARSNQWRAMKGHLDTAGEVLSLGDASGLFTRFEASNASFTSATWSAERSLESFPYRINEITILKQAVLSRAGGLLPIFSKGRWVPALFVLTDSGYLHCFKEAHGSKAAAAKRSASVRGGAGVPPTAARLAAEEAEEPVYEKLEKPKTYYRAGRISVELVPEKSSLHVFAVVVHTKGKVDSPRGASNAADSKKGTVRHEVRASSEQEMVEWVAALREKITSYLPDGPPTPLFSSPQEIEHRVDATIARKMSMQASEATLSSPPEEAVQPSGKPMDMGPPSATPTPPKRLFTSAAHSSATLPDRIDTVSR
ncbi:hypothetical protein HK101_006829 [Irineochytrium annulatum]|nr:hypothetical protein HK101_006829 [Irineochytrium annulatum]